MLPSNYTTFAQIANEYTRYLVAYDVATKKLTTFVGFADEITMRSYCDMLRKYYKMPAIRVWDFELNSYVDLDLKI
jgi:hypothetical protein